MSSDQRVARAASFGGVAKMYDSARPGYPGPAVRWLVGDRPCRVLDLGAGTGKLTRALAAAGHEVVAVDPSGPMLQQLSRSLPAVDARTGTAEAIPTPDGSVDAVVVAQAFHWVDRAAAVPEIARVLRPGGRLGLVWNLRDESVPWVRELWAVIAPDEPRLIQHAELPAGSPFGPLDAATFGHAQWLDREAVLALAQSRSYVAVQPPARRAELLAAAAAVIDRHSDGGPVTLPYTVHCFRAQRT
jgi:SAM-dependent methyltransferase